MYKIYIKLKQVSVLCKRYINNHYVLLNYVLLKHNRIMFY